MATRIRLRRMGAKKAPFYRIVVADSRYPRDGRFIEEIGYYDPTKNPSLIKINEERAKYWMGTGALPSETVKTLMVAVGILAASPFKTTAAPESTGVAQPVAPAAGSAGTAEAEVVIADAEVAAAEEAAAEQAEVAAAEEVASEQAEVAAVEEAAAEPAEVAAAEEVAAEPAEVAAAEEVAAEPEESAAEQEEAAPEAEDNVEG